MKLIHRHAVLGAAPEEVWAYLAHGPNWVEWDPDLTEVYASDRVMEEGGTLDSQLGPLRGEIHFRDVQLHEHVVWEISVLGGLVQARGIFDLAPTDGGTAFDYRFGMGGWLGGLMARFNPGAIVKGTEDGLANLVARFSS